MGRGPRGNSAACSALCRFWVTSPATDKQIGAYWCWFPGGWACVYSRTLWVSPMNSPVRLGVSSAAAWTPTSVFSQRLWGFILLCWDPGLSCVSRSPDGSPSLSACERGTAQSASHRLTQSTSHCLATIQVCPAAQLCPSHQSGWMFLL